MPKTNLAWRASAAAWSVGLIVTCGAATLLAEPATDQTSGAAVEAAAAENSYSPGDAHVQNSRVYIHVGKTGLGHEHAVVGMLKSGALHLAGSNSAGEVVFDMKTFSADSDAARKYIGLAGATDAGTRQQVDANMLGPSVLNVSRYPTATFVLKSATPLKMASRRGLPQYQLTGDFTLHGVTRPIQVIADVESQEGWVHLRGGFSILQSQFGIQPFSKAFGAIGVTDKLTIWGDLWLAAEPASTNALPATRSSE